MALKNGYNEMGVRHFLTLADFSKDELMSMIEVIGILKDYENEGFRLPLLKGTSLGMMFDQPSTRTRVSFEVAMTQLGGHALFLESKTLHVGEDRETIADTTKVLSSMCDMLMVRTDTQETIEEMAKHSTVPLLNGMTLLDLHPTQALCDVFTMLEHMPPKKKKVEDLVCMFISNNASDGDFVECVFKSQCRIMMKLGMTVIGAAPPEYKMSAEEEAYINSEMKKSGGKLILTDDPMAYIKKVDFITTDSWWYHGSDDLKEKNISIFMPKYQINNELLSHAPKHCKVLHCLPGNRGYEITNEVWDGPQSLLFEEAENRLHTQKGLIAWFSKYIKKTQVEDFPEHYMTKTEEIINNVG